MEEPFSFSLPFKATLSTLLSLALASPLLAHDYHHQSDFPTLAEGSETVGDGHGEVAVSSRGEIYVSVQGGPHPGLQVYSAEGAYLRNVKGAPTDFHGFVIHQESAGEFIYGVGLSSGTLFKLALDGAVVFSTPFTVIPEALIGQKKEQLAPRFTSCDVAPDGTIYVVDGYGTDNIHLFEPDGSYRTTWVGRSEPYRFKNLHKIFIDPRYDEPRILGCDRANKRLVHLALNGTWIGEFATDLRRPSSAAFF
ncbi:MAG: hypothetical protein AAF357_18945, partial [Verrucomicrobiota bacterium]